MGKNSYGLDDEQDDFQKDPDPFFSADDEIEVTFDGEDADGDLEAPRRGQNEDPDFEARGERQDGDIDDLENPSIRNRIMRERRLRQEESRMLTDQLEKAEDAILASEKKALKTQADSFKLAIDGMDVRLETAREALIQAREAQDVGAETKIEAQIRQLEQLRSNIESQQARLPTEAQLDQAFQTHRAQTRAQRQQGRQSEAEPLNDLASRWRDRNGWMDDPRHAEARKVVVTASEQLAREGYAPDTQEHFVELTRRMAKSFPDLEVKDLAGRQMAGAPRRQSPSPQQRRSQPPPVGGNRNQAASPNPGGNRNPRRVELNGLDAKTMRMFGIDPADKKATAYYAKEKLADIRRSARQER
jgi:hypothetical protein